MNNASNRCVPFHDRIAVQFDYPRDEHEMQNEEDYRKRLLEVINYIISQILSSRNPRASIFALAYCIKLDLTSVVPALKANTTRAYAERLGICQKSFHNHVRKAKETLKI